jgi:DHA3 family macrolide efflux protein-like MFS transporter
MSEMSERMKPEAFRPRWAVPFFTLWTGEALSLAGSQLAQFALVWWLTQKTGSATILAMAALVAALPGICFGPIIGALVDRWDRRTTMLVADGAVALAAAVLVLLFWLGRVEPWHIFPVLLIRGIGGSFQWPAMVASTSLMVPHEQLPRIQGLNQMLAGVMSILVPPLAALCLGLMALHTVLLIDVITAAIACGILLFIAVPRPKRAEATAASAPPTVWAEVREGLLLIRSWPGIRLLLIMAALNNLVFTPVSSLLPILTTKHFGGGVLQLGWLQSVAGVGLAIGGMAIGIGGGFGRPMVTALAGLVGMGIGVMAIGLAPATAFWMALAGLFLAHFMLPIMNAPLQAVLQMTVPPEMQGRVFSVLGSLTTGIAPIGLLLAGPVADLLGVRSWYLMGGVAFLLMGGVGFLIPAVLNLVENAGKVAPGTSGSRVPGERPAVHAPRESCRAPLPGAGSREPGAAP